VTTANIEQSTGGVLSYAEINSIVERVQLPVMYDTAAAAAYTTFDGNQWVSWDDAKTLPQKVDFGQKNGLRGLFIWAIDHDDRENTALQALLGDTFADTKNRAGNQLTGYVFIQM
jgi:chitinase